MPRPAAARGKPVPAAARARRRPTLLGRDPLRLLRRWIRLARRAGLEDPEAMTLATASARGRPSARMVLLRGLDARGLVFFTNYRSRKGRELESNPRAALVFYWREIARQVRVEGAVRRLTSSESDLYFASRARQAQLASWASEQSRPIPGRAHLMRRFRDAERRFRGGPVPRPPGWGGYRLEPVAFEFWRARAHRLHERVRYERRRGGWRGAMLAP